MKKIFLMLLVFVSVSFAQSFNIVRTNGSATSASFDTKYTKVFSVIIPSGYNGSTIRLETSSDGTNFYYAGNIDAITVTKGQAVVFSPSNTFWLKDWTRFRSDSVAVGADTMEVDLGTYYNK